MNDPVTPTEVQFSDETGDFVFVEQVKLSKLAGGARVRKASDRPARVPKRIIDCRSEDARGSRDDDL
jgi:hypothetical protein